MREHIRSLKYLLPTSAAIVWFLARYDWTWWPFRGPTPLALAVTIGGAFLLGLLLEHVDLEGLIHA